MSQLVGQPRAPAYKPTMIHYSPMRLNRNLPPRPRCRHARPHSHQRMLDSRPQNGQKDQGKPTLTPSMYTNATLIQSTPPLPAAGRSRRRTGYRLARQSALICWPAPQQALFAPFTPSRNNRLQALRTAGKKSPARGGVTNNKKQTIHTQQRFTRTVNPSQARTGTSCPTRPWERWVLSTHLALWIEDYQFSSVTRLVRLPSKLVVRR